MAEDIHGAEEENFSLAFHQMIEEKPRKEADRNGLPKAIYLAAQVIFSNVPALIACALRAAVKE